LMRLAPQLSRWFPRGLCRTVELGPGGNNHGRLQTPGYGSVQEQLRPSNEGY